MRDLVSRVVEAVGGLELSRVPQAALQAAGLMVADSVGIGWAGAATPEMQALLQEHRAEGMVGEAGRSRVWGPRRLAADAATAAYLNGVAGTFPALDPMALDSQGRGGGGHPAMHLVPAALAAAEAAAAPGRDLLRAVVVGCEIATRLHGALKVVWPAHENGHISAVGAAAAVALLEGVDPLESARVAATMPLLTVWDACFDGATARGAWFGHGARAGVEAVRMARAGFKGSGRALETAFGTIAGRMEDPQAAAAPLDYERLAVSRTLFKRHAACYGTHTALDALAGIDLPEPASVRRILVEVPRIHAELGRTPLADNTLAGQFSVPYAIATAVQLGATDFAAFGWRPEVAKLAQHVEVKTTNDLEPWGARVTIESNAGRVVGESRSRPRPLPWEGVQARFRQQVGEPAELWWSRLTNLSTVADCARLFETGTL